MVSYITDLNDVNYKGFVENGIILVDIKAEWCNPCRAIAPIVDELSSEYHGKISVGKLDADESSETISELGIRNIPTLLLYRNGEVVDKVVGSVTKQRLVEMIDKYLS